MRTRVNFSKGIPYHTQRNNMQIPLRACNSTSYIMAGKQAGWVMNMVPAGVQEEDYLTNLMRDRESFDYVQNNLGEWAREYPVNRLNEIHAVMRFAFNRMVDAEAATFHTNVSVEDIARELQNDRGVVVPGEFETTTGTIGHVVSLAGYILDSEQTDEPVARERIQGFILDDPYGNHQTKYKDHRGNDIDMEIGEFLSRIKERHSEFKWAHIIEPSEEY